MIMSDMNANIKQLLSEHSVVLYMKGTPSFPMCGFSSQVVHVLNKHGATYHTVNVLEDQDVREGIKAYASWPTIPQLYIQSEFIGGCDIVCALDESGELKTLLEKA
jgi:monothiol glutaredoxin